MLSGAMLIVAGVGEGIGEAVASIGKAGVGAAAPDDSDVAVCCTVASCGPSRIGVGVGDGARRDRA